MRLAIIPARGGSKRIPGKNIKLFAGQPIIAYSIQAAIASKCFDRVIVSTDDEMIKAVAEDYGAEVPFMRPANISDDFSTTADVIKHAIQWLRGTYSDADTDGNKNLEITNQQTPELVCCLYATAPFVQASYLREGLEILMQEKCEYVFSATTYAFPVQRAIKLDNENRVTMFQPEHLNTRSQDLEEAYHDAGQFYWGRAEAFMQDKAIFGETSRIVKLPRHLVQDIDTAEDWQHAELLYQTYQKSLERQPQLSQG
ncbi:CMP-N,N'-diacetyllegionaminic acid synthase [Thalassocella blandensis]|nr:CMP-N,N'-diacetyllegionaminic acid synthase [Thalassocella blandensis]